MPKTSPYPNVTVVDHPLVQHKLTILRDVETGSKQFRELVKELAMLMAYEATRDFQLSETTVTTPLTETTTYVLAGKKVAVIPILRAGLGMVEGVWDLMPSSEVWHIGLYRDERTLRPVEYYNKLPVDPTVQVCIILDPMLATGGSAVATVDILKRWGAKRIKYIGIIAAPEGIKRLQEAHPDVEIYLAVVLDFAPTAGLSVPVGPAGFGLDLQGDMKDFGSPDASPLSYY